MLGETYAFTRSQLAETKEKYPLEFIEDFKSRLWFTYRTGFPAIRPSEYVSDVGWGCMLRSAQMLLGQALVMQKLGRGWRKNCTSSEKERTYIVRLFLDDLNSQTPFSLHNFCIQGRQLGKNIGEWFGPFTASQAIRALVNSYQPLDLGVYVATDSVIYKDQLRMLTQGNKPLLVLLPTRLGINTLNPIYFHGIKKLLGLPQSLGIAGYGKPSASLYFLAYEGDSLYYLDPHYPRPATSTKLTEEELSTYHCSEIRTINIQKIDPCMLFGFYCRDQADIDLFLQRLEEVSECSRIRQASV
ncbi:peptidase C54 [Basidiobolus meristosporus CBS 931.73]|uniref:Cysteine protease n=1 Tax=Basidiobolus meristosporus CBS 931.73 TaxID=1314790 RepID=A0A1Y1XUM7_9FUNG|nr:peptidase C54 [Basidiobolus meristosporus CBS 931.73]|eukprot:ORX89196.1 peptidase C54 [Basidiobolus meristosporus CBS 931.73]